MSIEELGKFADGFRVWRRVMAAATDADGKWHHFANAAREVAQYCPKGLDKAVAVDELQDIANAYGLDDLDHVQNILSQAFHDIETDHVPDVLEQHVNGHDKAPLVLPLRRFAAPPPAKLPRRQWLHAGHYIRQHVVMTVAPGGYGKTALVILNAIEMASGCGILGPAPDKLRVLYWNAEEPEEEVERRIAAICLRYRKAGINIDLLKENLFLGSAISETQAIAKADRFGQAKNVPEIIAAINEFIREHKIDCAIFDPLVSFHFVKEVDTIGMDKMMKGAFGYIAKERNCCIELAQHTRKPSMAAELTVDDARGAGAITAAARSVRVLNRMTKQEAASVKIKDNGGERPLRGEERRLYLRVSRDKINYIPPDKASWIHLVDQKLPNDGDGMPGDHVQVVEAWEYPQAMDGIKAEDMYWIRNLVRNNRTYNKSPVGSNWIGKALAEHLGLDAKDDKPRLKDILGKWFDNGVLATEPRKNSKGDMREFVIPGNWKDAPEPEEDELPFA